MMFTALLSIVLVFATVLVAVETRVRRPPPDQGGFQTFFRQVEKICIERPDLIPDCDRFLEPPGARGNNAPNNPNETRPTRLVLPFLDPRPWVLPALISSTVVAALTALALALVLGRRIAQPVVEVSSAARRLADGQLNTRVPVPSSRDPADETAQLARSFNSMAQALEQNENERRQLIADIAHELRTPLTVMQSRLEALEDGVFPLEPSEITRLQTQTRFLSRLVEDLRLLSLADAGRLSLEKRPVNLETLALEVAHAFESRAERDGKRIRLSTKPVTVNADPDRMRQVLTNLLENALKYTRSEVQLQLCQQGTQVRISIADDGDGLLEVDLERVFDRFFRADESRNRASGGSGLGLSIVRAIVELHGGRIEARNRVPHGAEFNVQLEARN
jgi:two-component system, OmpR family, sensor histidine kinase BaeS